MNDQKDRLKQAWDDYEGFKNIKTALVFIFAYLIAVVSNGFIEGFDPELLISLQVGLGTMGLLGAIQAITAEGATRGNVDAEETDTQLADKKATIRTKSIAIDRAKAADTLKLYNAKQIIVLRKEAYERKVQSLEDDIKVTRNRIDTLETLTRWWQLPTQWVVGHLKRKEKKLKKVLSKQSIEKTFIKYQPLELDDIIFLEKDGTEKRTKKQRMQETPARRTLRRMTKANILKTLFFFGMQGAAYASLFGRRGLLWFLLMITFTLVATLLTSYVMTKRFATGDYKQILEEKLQDIEWLIKEQNDEKNTAQYLKENGVVTFYPKEKGTT